MAKITTALAAEFKQVFTQEPQADGGYPVVASAGQMTLYVELYDSVTNTLLPRVIDPEADNRGLAGVASSVTNKVAADQILRRWADTLRKHLEAVQPPPGNATPAVN